MCPSCASMVAAIVCATLACGKRANLWARSGSAYAWESQTFLQIIFSCINPMNRERWAAHSAYNCKNAHHTPCLCTATTPKIVASTASIPPGGTASTVSVTTPGLHQALRAPPTSRLCDTKADVAEGGGHFSCDRVSSAGFTRQSKHGHAVRQHRVALHQCALRLEPAPAPQPRASAGQAPQK